MMLSPLRPQLCVRNDSDEKAFRGDSVVRCIYHIDFRNLVEVHELGPGEHINEKSAFVSVNLL